MSLAYVLPKTGDDKLRQACEFHDDTYFYWTPTSSETQTATVSLWFRRSKRDAATMFLFDASTASATDHDRLYINSSHQVEWNSMASSVIHTDLVSTATVDDQDWHHVVVQLDFGNGTQAERAKLYLDGSEVTYSGTPLRPTGGTNFPALFTAQQHTVGWDRNNTAGQATAGVMADFNLVESTVVVPGAFGKSTGGNWVHKSYGGVHGANGMRLFWNPTEALGKNTRKAA